LVRLCFVRGGDEQKPDDTGHIQSLGADGGKTKRKVRELEEELEQKVKEYNEMAATPGSTWIVTMILLLSLSATVCPVSATTTTPVVLIVNSTYDNATIPGYMTLRQALSLANVPGGSTTIKFSPSIAGGTISLQHGPFNAIQCAGCSIRIDASGGPSVTLDGLFLYNILLLNGNVSLRSLSADMLENFMTACFCCCSRC